MLTTVIPNLNRPDDLAKDVALVHSHIGPQDEFITVDQSPGDKSRIMAIGNVLVTGASGFIGRKLVEQLLKSGYRVVVLTRHESYKYSSIVNVKVGDLATGLGINEKLFEGVQVIFNCAGELRDTNLMNQVHINGTRNLLRAISGVSNKMDKPFHWIQLSSVGAYGPALQANHSRRITEASEENPVGEYETTKTESDHLVMQASKKGLITHTILRPSNVLGSDMSNQSLRGLISMVKRGLFFYIGKPGAVATYVHVDDVVAALMKCAFEPKARGQTYNISNDCLLEDLIKCIASVLGVRPPRIRIPESLIRAAVGIFEGRVNIPLTTSRIDALVNKTRYPADKIVSELGFKFSMPMPLAIEDLVKKAGA